MRYPKLREIKEALKALVKGPYTSPFPFQEHKPFERFRGRPKFHEDDCIGCGACVQICPAGALSMEDVAGKRILTVRWDTCIFCGQCQLNCLTEKGIILSNEFDLATTEKREELKQSIEKKLVLCSCCQEVIAPYDQILWVAKKLGPLVYSNASLMLFYSRHQGLAEKKDIIKEDKDFQRSDRIKILCPRCRRETVIKS